MESAKQKVTDMTIAAKAKLQTAKAKVEEQVAQVKARTEEEKEIAKEVRKVKEAEAKAEKAKKLEAKHAAGYQVPATGTTTAQAGHHVLPATETTAHAQPQTFEGAGNIPPSTAYPIPYNKRL